MTQGVILLLWGCITPQHSGVNMVESSAVNIRKAEDLGNNKTIGLVISITESIVDLIPNSDSHNTEVFENEARTLADALFLSLPGGTIDALLV